MGAGGTFNRVDGLPSAVSTVYATRALVDVLCELAADADPNQISVRLVATPAGALEPVEAESADADSAGVRHAASTDLDPGTPVLSDFYFPDAGESITNVFGVDLATPTGQTAGRFVSHPIGNQDVSITDDLHAQLLVAIPPWDATEVRAYDRNGSRRDLVLVAAETPEPEETA